MISEEQYNRLHLLTKKYIDKNCIIRNKKMPGKLPGTTYTWMFYLRNGLFNHVFLSAISQMFIYKINKEIRNFDFQITGLETGSTPLLSAIPLVAREYNLDINSFSIRKERKEYGLLNYIEGIPNKKPCLIVDDLCNSSASMRRAYDILLAHKLTVFNYSFCIVNKVNKKIHDKKRIHTDMYLPNHNKIIYLFDLDDFNLYNPSH